MTLRFGQFCHRRHYALAGPISLYHLLRTPFSMIFFDDVGYHHFADAISFLLPPLRLSCIEVMMHLHA